MNTKIIIAVATACLTFVHPFDVPADPNPDTGPGCGLGKLAWGEYQHYKNIAPQVMMASTNVTGSYWFAIASGTSGCTNDGHIMAEQKATDFVAVNFENIFQEMAQGHGEHLTTLAAMIGIPKEQQEGTFAMLQARYGELIQADQPTPMELVRALRASIPPPGTQAQ
jgi:hypothetical protein